jgi:hypothetical protein
MVSATPGGIPALSSMMFAGTKQEDQVALIVVVFGVSAFKVDAIVEPCEKSRNSHSKPDDKANYPKESA